MLLLVIVMISMMNQNVIYWHSHPKLNKSEKYISKLIDKTKQQTNESVFVGIAKMNNWETFEKWKHRAIKNVNQHYQVGYEIESNTVHGL